MSRQLLSLLVLSCALSICVAISSLQQDRMHPLFLNPSAQSESHIQTPSVATGSSNANDPAMVAFDQTQLSSLPDAIVPGAARPYLKRNRTVHVESIPSWSGSTGVSFDVITPQPVLVNQAPKSQSASATALRLFPGIGPQIVSSPTNQRDNTTATIDTASIPSPIELANGNESQEANQAPSTVVFDQKFNQTNKNASVYDSFVSSTGLTDMTTSRAWNFLMHNLSETLPKNISKQTWSSLIQSLDTVTKPLASSIQNEFQINQFSQPGAIGSEPANDQNGPRTASLTSVVRQGQSPNIQSSPFDQALSPNNPQISNLPAQSTSPITNQQPIQAVGLSNSAPQVQRSETPSTVPISQIQPQPSQSQLQNQPNNPNANPNPNQGLVSSVIQNLTPVLAATIGNQAMNGALPNGPH